jgi:hypothetical protein
MMNQLGFNLPSKKASYKWWTIQEWKEKAEKYKFGEHFIKSLVDLLHQRRRDVSGQRKC